MSITKLIVCEIQYNIISGVRFAVRASPGYTVKKFGANAPINVKTTLHPWGHCPHTPTGDVTSTSCRNSGTFVGSSLLN